MHSRGLCVCVCVFVYAAYILRKRSYSSAAEYRECNFQLSVVDLQTVVTPCMPRVLCGRGSFRATPQGDKWLITSLCSLKLLVQVFKKLNQGKALSDGWE